MIHVLKSFILLRLFKNLVVHSETSSGIIYMWFSWCAHHCQLLSKNNQVSVCACETCILKGSKSVSVWRTVAKQWWLWGGGGGRGGQVCSDGIWGFTHVCARVFPWVLWCLNIDSVVRGKWCSSCHIKAADNKQIKTNTFLQIGNKGRLSHLTSMQCRVKERRSSMVNLYKLK